MATTTFEVKLDGVRLDEKQIRQIEADIQAVVGRSIANVVPRDSVVGSKLKIRPEWYGLWLKTFKNIEELRLDKEFQQFKQ